MEKQNIELINLDKKGATETVVFEIPEVEVNSHELYLLDRFQKLKLRTGSSAVKNRSAVSGGGAKPYKQKGTGRARRGTNRSPLRRGGGVIFGPVVREYGIKLNKQQIKKVVKQYFASNISKVKILNVSDELLKVSEIYKNLSKAIPDFLNKKVVLIQDENNMSFIKSVSNLPNLIVMSKDNISVSSVLYSDFILVSQETLKSIVREDDEI